MAAKARFVSRYGNYSVGVQSLVKEHYGTGESKVLKPRIDAQFHNHLVTDEDFAVALSSFTFPGLPEDFDTNAHISPRYRVSVWDSEVAQREEGWSDEQIDMMIARLREGVGVDHIELVSAPSKAPFPAYDTLSVEEILQIVKLTSIDPESVVKYERENQNREELIERLAPAKRDDVVVVNAG